MEFTGGGITRGTGEYMKKMTTDFLFYLSVPSFGLTVDGKSYSTRLIFLGSHVIMDNNLLALDHFVELCGNGRICILGNKTRH